MHLSARQFEFTFPSPALVMGIVNVTPDSFSDGGQFLDPEAAIAHALELVAQGADILDIGGESTRPRSAPVDEAEELRRVLPVIEGLAGRVRIPISIDTTKVSVARAALRSGASIVNDVAANRTEEGMWRVVADAQAGYVCMHMQGTPETMQDEPAYGDVIREVMEFFEDRIGRLSNCGLSNDHLILDTGIGFGKTPEHNLRLLSELGRFAELERPLLVGASRKSFIGQLLGADVTRRLPASLACACQAVATGAQIIRAHDVAETVQAVRMTEAILAQKK